MKRFAALLSGLCVVGAMLSATPATAADYVVSGAVTSDNGKVTSGEVHFFATCQDFEEFNPAASDSIESGEYSVTVPPGKYRALIRPAVGTGALESWHSEKTSCAQATEVEVTGNTPLDLVALAGSNVTGTVASKNGDTESGAIYYFATCQDYRDETPAASASFTSHTYALTVPDGEYLVQILPERGTGALDSWHRAKTSCADADPVEVSGDTTVDLEAIAGSNVKGHVSSGHGTVTDGEVVFYTDCQAFEDDKPTANAYLSNGDYLTTVPDGEYLVRITPYDASGALQSWHSAKDSCDTADPVEVSGDTDADLVAVAGSQVSGTVTSSNGTVSGGSVEFYEDCAAFEDGQPSAGTTINTGTYTLFVADGTYLARILPDSGTGAVESWHSAEQSCDAAAVVTVEGTTPANLVALAGYPVSGSVSSSNGPVSTGYVHFFATCQDYDNHLAAASFEIANGTYSVDLPNGTYRVRIEPGDGEAALTSWHSARVFCEQADLVTVSGTTTADLIASPGSPVTGTVSSSRGPVNSARVQFYATCEDYEDHDIAAQDRVDGKQYQVTLPNGTYRVWIEPEPGETALESWHAAKPSCEQADVVTVTGAATVNLTASPGSVASGQVTSSRGPVDRGEVSFYASCQDAQPVGYAEIEAGQYAATLPDGPYRVRIHPYGATGAVDSWHDAKPTCDQAKVVNVTGDTAVDLVATAGSQVSGTVTRGSTPVGDGTVFFFAGCQDPNPTRVGIEAGTYEITVPDGTYRVLIAQYGSDGQTSSWHSAKTSCASADVVTVGGDTTADLVAAPTSKVAGQVTADQGASVSSGNVYFYATCQDYADGNVTATSSLKRGSYTAALPDGSYRAFITPRTGAALSWHNAKATCVQADPITVSGATTADLVVATGAVVTGGVTSSNGVVLRGTVTFLNGCQRDNEKAVTRDAFAGSYTVNLLPGTYRVFINPDSGTGAKDSWHAAKPSCETADAVTVSGNATVDLVASAKGGSPPGPTPEPTTSPTPTPPPVTPVTQSVKKPPAKLKKGKKAALAKKTKQGAKVTWKSTTKKVCTVKKYTVKAKKKGTCKLSAKAPAIPGYAAFAKKFPIRVR
jgi:hypothetical protein